jgi:hypothetical protein
MPVIFLVKIELLLKPNVKSILSFVVVAFFLNSFALKGITMRWLFSLVVLVYWLPGVFAQTYVVSGRVMDADSRMALPFVNMVLNQSDQGGTTDIDGKFIFRSNEPIEFLRLSYVGYEPLFFPVTENQTGVVIGLKKVEYELPEFVVYPTENPAHRIIDNAIAFKDKNDPEKLPAFTYNAYDKMIFTLDPDSLSRIDTLISDTSSNEMHNFFDNHHLFIMESVVERKFKFPGNNEEKVIATKVSGFKDPIFVFLISQWQSTSFYGDLIEIAGKKYVNPISRGSTNKYFFLLQDTLLYGKLDTVFVISYRPLMRTSFDGLKGTISINTRNWAIQNVIAEPAEGGSFMTFRMEHLYEQIEGETWFPVQINNVAYLNQLVVGDSSASIVMGTVRDTVGKRIMSIPFGMGKRYIRDINLYPELRNRNFGNAAVVVDPNANFRDETYWLGHRIDSLTMKELNTYRYIDSLGKAENFDRMAKSLESILTGKIPWGYFNLDLHRFLRYNNYEGLAPGLGIETNERLSPVFSAGGYFRYGLKDDAIKWGTNVNLELYHPADLGIGFSYMDDVLETGGVDYWDDIPSLLHPEYFRHLLVRDMDKVKEYSAYIGFRTVKYMNVVVELNKTHKTVTDNYRFAISNESVNVYFDRFDFTELVLGFRYAYREKFIKNLRNKISLGTDFPIIWFKFSQGFAGFLDGDFEYNRYDLKIEKSFRFKYLGTTTLKVNAGYVDADIPQTNLFNGNGSYRQFTLFAPNSFATMRMNEFLLSRYGALYFTHDFAKLLMKGGFFKPEFAIASNIGFGSLEYTESHHEVNYKTMEEGYYESGLLINNLLNLKIYSIGVGAFYRYGPYAFDTFIENAAFKVTLKLNLSL